MHKAIIFDTETTGLVNPDIIEAAWIEISSPKNTIIVEEFTRRYKPSKIIELGALATHHILDEELADCEPSSEFRLPVSCEYIIGHNIDFDWNAIGNPEVKRICTKALSRWLLPLLDSHSQSSLIYYFHRDRARSLLRNAHSALADVNNCRLVLISLLYLITQQNIIIESWDDLWKLSEEARVPTIMSFGKHKGESISSIPSDYKRWLSNQTDVDPYLKLALGK